MDVTGISTTVMLAVAAGLWFLYLVPTWLRRREYLSTERTATRLQQTLRVMAETAEVPDVVRVEASAREAARQDRLLRAQQRRADVVAARQATAISRSVPAAPVDPALLRRARARRARLVATLLMATATVVGVVQIGMIAAAGAVVGSWLVLAAAAGLGFVAIGMRRRVDARSAPQQQARPVHRPVVASQAAPQRARRAAWTPTPLPKPLYLDTPAPQPVVPAVDPAVALRAAAAEAERARRAAEAEPEVVPLRRTAASARLSRMGRIDPRDTEATDLDEVLRRRRSAG